MSMQNIMVEEWFTVENFKCNVEIERPERYKNNTAFKISEKKEERLELVYRMNDGLVLVTGQENEFDSETVIGLYEIGKLYIEYKKLKAKKKTSKAKVKLKEAENKLCEYIKTFGFFVPVPEGQWTEYKSERLLRLVERYCVTMELKQEISLGKDINYKRLFELTFFLVFAVDPIIEYWNGESDKDDKDQCDYSVGGSWAEKSRWVRHGKIVWSDLLYNVVEFKEIDGEELNFVINRERDKLKGYKYYENEKEIYNLIKIIHEENENDNIADFLWGFVNDVCPICKINVDGTIEQKLGDALRENKYFQSKYKDRLIKIAKDVCAKEISNGIKKAIPACNPNTMNLDVKVPNLLTALYLALFYFGQKGDTYHICMRKECRRIFKLKEGARPRKYCSDYCMDRAAKSHNNHKKSKKNLE